MAAENGAEILRNNPFTEVVLPQEEAVSLLTEETRSIFKSNIAVLLQHLNKDNPYIDEYRAKFIQMSSNPEEFVPPGGVSLSEKEMGVVYNKWGSLPFNRIIQKFIGEVFPQLNRNYQARNPGVTNLGCFLDMLKIIDPKVASFEDGVQAIAETMREGGYQLDPWFLGAAVDDTMHMRGTIDTKFDFFADRKGAKKFAAAYLKVADSAEKDLFEKGIKITLTELYSMVGISLN